MLTNYISTTKLLTLSKSNNQKSVLVLNYLNFAGTKDFISNLNILYIYDLTTNKVITYKTLSHTPRVPDLVEIMNSKDLGPPENILFIAKNKNPFSNNKIQAVFKDLFGDYLLFKSYQKVSTVIFFDSFVKSILNETMTNFKNLHSPCLITGKKPDFQFELPIEVVDTIINYWNLKSDVLLTKALDSAPEYKALELKK